MLVKAAESSRRRHALRLGLAVLLLGGLALGTPSTGYSSLATADVNIIGEEEVVFDWTTDRCAMTDIPDLPARAFRDADGQVQLIAAHHVNRRMVGESLDSLDHKCPVVLASDRDIDPGRFNFKEWIGALYTTDGETVHALVHMEYEGDKASRWDAERDFSTVQGEKNWRYQAWNGLNYRDMHYDAQDDRWRGGRNLCTIRPHAVHPDGPCEPARTWVSPVNDTVKITGNVRDFAPEGGDGVVARIFHNDRELWSETIANGDTEGTDFRLQVEVTSGDAIRFRVNQRANPRYDSTHFAPKVNVGPDPCLSSLPSQCQMMTVTYARSTDGGATYTHAVAPEHRVATLPYRYESDSGLWGIWQPSNIVRNPDDGYYYTALHVEEYRQQERGTCIIRTRSLDDPTSWRAWDGDGFNVRFIDPYRQPNADPAEHVCEPVLAPLTASLTYNRYFDQFMLTGVAVHNVPAQGFYYALSDDLVHWSERRLLMETRLGSQTGHCAGRAYPSLLDPSVDSRNFEVTDQRPYLYFTRFNGCTPGTRGMDRDLMRVQIEFTN